MKSSLSSCKVMLYLKIVFFFAIGLLPVQELLGADLKTIDSLLHESMSVQYDQKEIAIAHVKMARELAKDLDDPKLMARINNQEGTVHYISGDYELALRDFLEAYEYAIKVNSIPEKEYAMNGRALVLMVEREFVVAKDLFEACILINATTNDSVKLAKNHFNLGILHNEQGDLDQSMVQLNTALNFLTNYPKQGLNLMVNNRMAKVYYELGDYENALSKYNNVLQDSLSLTNWEKTFALTGLAQLKFETGHTEEALALGKEAYSTAKFHGANWDLQKITELLSVIYKEEKLFDKAHYYLELSQSYRDSLYDKEKSRQIARLQLKLTQVENEKLRAESDKDQTTIKQNNRLFIFLTLLILFLGFTIYFYRKNIKLKEQFNGSLKKKNRAIEKQKSLIDQQNKNLIEINAVKTKLLSVISHDLRSPITSIKQLLEMRGKGYFTKEDENEAYDHLTTQIQNAETMLNDLLEWANRQMDGLESNPSEVALSDVVTEVLLGYNFQTKTKFINTEHSENQSLQIEIDRVQLKIILQNLIGNAIKFTPEYGTIKVYYEANERFVICHIEDSGVGVDENYHDLINSGDYARIPSMAGTANEKGTGLGILLVKQFLDLNGGKLKMESEPGLGTHFILYFKR
ncbi:tetratricopeptide repeat-containing sensor histidine kinase [Cyclobacterium qasimii]|uniref:tetratricopeptide repeat-containing sensor histidine kinase n=1 Tax=Cyclobacterium qasimii TaxID=1350429 RepID=UPI0013778F27|nr:tetratricopeptide repeat-containing sensor histidine kinase [Cyclobacterium qasimii]